MIDVILRAVAERLSINKFVETGTYEGESVAQVALWFSEMSPDFGKVEKLVTTGAKGLNPWNTYIAYPVFSECHQNSDYKIYSVDVDSEKVAAAKEAFASNPNIVVECSSSENFLKSLIDNEALTDRGRVLFFLDAHWNDYWPLRDEIIQILKLLRFAIVVDDFAVPGHPEFGFDTYKDGVCDWKLIKDLFSGRDVTVYYPRRSNRDCRGWVLILAGFTEEEVTSLRTLPLFRNTLRDRIFKPSWFRWLLLMGARSRFVRFVYYHQKWRIKL